MKAKSDAAGAGGEGSDAPEKSGSDDPGPEVRVLVKEAVDREVAGLKHTNASLKEEKRALAERLKGADLRVAELEGQLGARDEQLSRLVVDGEIRQAAAKAGLIASAVEDALYRGRQVFVLDAEGEAIARDAEGKPVLGKDGKMPLTPAAWLESMREAAPHWWPPSAGAGAPGAGSDRGDRALTYEQAGALNPEHYARLRREGRIA